MKVSIKWMSAILVIATGALFVGGCSSSKEEEYGNKKEDYKVPPPPDYWRAPNDPRGPAPAPGEGKTTSAAQGQPAKAPDNVDGATK